jgi:single-strand DNA-binding protein
MANLNKVLLIGRLTRDPELRYTQGGTAVTEVGLAVNREFTTSDGTRKKETCFVDVVLWARRAEVACQYLRKGSPLFVEGRLELDQWQGPDGAKRSRLRVVADNFQFLDRPGDRSGGPPAGGAGAGAGAGAPAGAGARSEGRPPRGDAPTGGANEDFGLEDDVPF